MAGVSTLLGSSANMLTLHAEPQDIVASTLAESIIHELRADKKVLWLLSGGSGGKLCVDAAAILRDADVDLSNLYAALSDERYGPVGHPDENHQQLLDAGLALPGAHIYRVLSEDTAREQTAKNFSDWLDSTLRVVDYRIALLGIGGDGHTSGIKPHSPAVLSDKSVVDFTGEDYERITTTAALLRKLDSAYVQAYGADKLIAIKTILSGNGDINETPGLLVHDIKDAKFFTDAK